MPRALLPVSETREYEEDGQFHFDVALKAPLGMGLMVRYKGRLAPAGEPEANAKIEVLYNGVCPVCRAGACDLERRAAAARAGVIFTDVAHNADALTRAGVTLDDVRLKLHALRPDGYVLRGMPAVALAWSATPPYQMLGRISRIPPFNWMAAAAYHVTAHVLWHWNRACGRW
jgi:predicted DCC family thiol-disulfide oxidoreductase YuxK